MADFGVGDLVRFRLAHEELEGTVLESSDSSVVLLKLPSGYNIGVPREHILRHRIIKKYKELMVVERRQAKQEGAGKGIGLIVTGGTIASRLDPRTGGVKPVQSVGEMAVLYPELFQKVAVKEVAMPFRILSESMSSEHWKEIAVIAEKMLNRDDINGIIITHGTDFLAYTGAALSFFLQDLNKPVVLTYSQRSIDRASSDAHLNLSCAVQMALSDCAEVLLVGHATGSDDYCYALRAVSARKLHSSKRDAFKAVNAESVARVFSDRIEFMGRYKKRKGGRVILDDTYSDKVALVKFYPGQDPSILDFYVFKYQGVVIEAAGLGHVAASDSLHSWIPALKKHIRNGFIVCFAPQTIFGRVDPWVYANGRDLQDAGVIFLEGMLAETALVKLGWVLGHYGWKKYVKEKMLENVAGELNDRITG